MINTNGGPQLPSFWTVFGPTMTADDVLDVLSSCLRNISYAKDAVALSQPLWVALREEVKLALTSGSLVAYFGRLTLSGMRIALALMFPHVPLHLTRSEKHLASWSQLVTCSHEFVKLAQDGWFDGPTAEKHGRSWDGGYEKRLSSFLCLYPQDGDAILLALKPSQKLLGRVALHVHKQRGKSAAPIIISAGRRHVIHLEMRSPEVLHAWIQGCKDNDVSQQTIQDLLVLHQEQVSQAAKCACNTCSI